MTDTNGDALIMRMMNAPAGGWPLKVDLNGTGCLIDYQDANGNIRNWKVVLRQARQGVASVMIDITRLDDNLDISLRLDRFIRLHLNGTAHDPLAYLAEAFGITVAMTPGPTEVPYVAPSGPLVGMKVVLTGQFETFSRAMTRHIVETRGGTPAGAIADDVNLVVIGSGGGQKADAARKRGIRCLNEAEFIELIGGLRAEEKIT